MQLLDVSIVNVAIPSIQANLNASFASVELVVAGYQLTFAVTLITASRLGDIYGRKKFFLIGMFGFTVASIICGAAPNATVLVVSRLVQGFFSGLMFPQVLSIIQITYPPQQRSKVFGIYGATIGLATITGPLVGGLLIKANLAHLDWRLIFYVNAPVGIVAFAGGFRNLTESRGNATAKLDLVGSGLITVGLGFLIYPLVEGRELGWPLWLKVMLLASIFVLVLFFYSQSRAERSARLPLINMSLLRSGNFVLGLVLFLVFFLGVAPFFFALSIFLQEGNGFTPLVSGLTSSPFALGAAVTSALTSRIKGQHSKTMLMVGSALLSLSMVLLILLLGNFSGQVSGYSLIPAMAAAGVGFGLFVGPASSLLMARVQSRDAGSASGTISTVQQVGGALGVTLISFIFFSLLTYNSGSAARSVIPSVTHQLQALSIPQSFISEGEGAFITCIGDRAAEKDPTKLPQSCLIIGGAIEQAPISTSLKSKLISLFLSAGNNAAEHDFLSSLREALVYEIAVFSIAFLLSSKIRGWPSEKEFEDNAAVFET